MKYKLLMIGMALGFALTADARDLSNKSSEYLRKLNEFEVEQVKLARKEIWQKRVLVVSTLTREMKELARKGDVDGAFALKTAIDKISGEVKLDAIKPLNVAKKEEKATAKELEKKLVGQTWKVRARNFQFEKRGTIVLTLDGQGEVDKGLWKWEVVGANVAEIKSTKGNVLKFTFTSETEGEQEWFNDGESQSVTPATLVE